MNLRRHQQVEQAFLAVLAARKGGAPACDETAHVAGMCAGDEEIVSEVRGLLKHLKEAGEEEGGSGFLNPDKLHNAGRPGGDESLLREWGGEAIGQRIDGFTIIGKLGEGGMGIVYVAEQANPRRTVALKIMRRSVATASTLK